MVLTETGLVKVFQRIKSFVIAQLNSKASAIHTHTSSDITDLPSGLTVDSTLDENSSNAISNSAVKNALDSKSDVGHTHVKSEITDFPTLSTVATSGSYNDLSNKPTIPTKVSDLTNDSGFLTSSGSCNYANSAGSASSATTSGAVSTVVDNGSAKDLVYAYMANNDAFRIRCGGESDAGYVEIATSDNGNEPIYVRQYNWNNSESGAFDQIVRTLTLLDESGNTQFPGTVTATTFSGNLTGNCSGSAGSVAWNNVSGKPTIPTKTSDLTNDSGFLTSHQDLSGYIPLSGTNALAGSIIPSTDNACDLGSSSVYFKNGYIRNLYTVCENTLTDYLFSPVIEYSDNLVWNSYTQIRCKLKNNYLLAQNRFISENSNSHWLFFISTPADSDRTETIVDLAHFGNGARFLAPYYSNISLGNGGSKWTDIYANNGTIQTSDERQKDNIKQIDDKLLQAWENVNIVQFNFKDALEKKGANARLHTGYIAQNIQQACEEKGVNPNDYGLFCHDSWEEQEEKKDESGQVIEPYRAKGDLYSLRYTEALVVECAYLRRENSKLKENLASLEERLEKLENQEK